MKTVAHLTYKDVDIDLDFTELETPEQVKGMIENFLLQGFKPRPKFVKNDAAKKTEDNVGKFGEIKFIELGKTKQDKPAYFLHILTDDQDEDTVKSGMIEMMSFPFTKGKKQVCMWELGNRVRIIKNDKGYLDLDDASDTSRDMTEEEKKATIEPPF